MIHIYFHESLTYHFKKTFSKNDYFYFPLKLSTGELYNMDKRKIIEIDATIYNQNYDYITSCLKQFKNTLIKNENYCIWYSDDSDEYCGYLYIVNLLITHTNQNIYTINCSKSISIHGALAHFSTSGELSSEAFEILKNDKKLLTKKDLENIISNYKMTSKTRCDFRLFRNNTLFHLDFKYLDKIFYTYINKNQSTIAEVIQHTRTRLNLSISEYIIVWRLLYLIDNNKLKVIIKRDNLYQNIVVTA